MKTGGDTRYSVGYPDVVSNNAVNKNRCGKQLH